MGGVCTWRISEDDKVLALQIELENDHAVTLTYRKNGDPPTVRLWRGNGEHDFGEDTIEAFRAWLEQASGRSAA